jgi:hypothetical protein
MILTFLGLSNKIITNETIPKSKPQNLSFSVSQQKKSVHKSAFDEVNPQNPRSILNPTLIKSKRSVLKT